MEETSLTPSEIAEKTVETAEKKAGYNKEKTLYLAILAGIYIAIGSIFANTTTTGGAGLWPFGVTKLLGGLAFSVGLILVLIGGGELFTGNTSLLAAWIEKKITGKKLLQNWLWVYLGNFIGSIFMAVIILISKQYTFGNDSVGTNLVKTATTKIHLGFVQAIALGIICNILVCLGVWLATSTKNIAGKILAIIFPITAFVAIGGEHSVANMYQLTAAWLIKIFDSAFIANLPSTDLNLLNIFFHNLLPVTIGNIIGGAIIWLGYWKIYLKNKC